MILQPVSWFLGGSRRQGGFPGLLPVGGGGGASALPIIDGEIDQGWLLWCEKETISRFRPHLQNMLWTHGPGKFQG